MIRPISVSSGVTASEVVCRLCQHEFLVLPSFNKKMRCSACRSSMLDVIGQREIVIYDYLSEDDS